MCVFSDGVIGHCGAIVVTSQPKVQPSYGLIGITLLSFSDMNNISVVEKS